MPLEGDAQGLVAYPLAKKGVNLRTMRQDLTEEEAFKTINVFWRDGIEKRGGYQKLDDDKVSGDNSITGLHRFYFNVVSRQLLASSGEEVRFLDVGTWNLVKDGLVADAPVLFETWGAKDRVYMGNGVDAPFQWDGTTVSAITNLTETVIQFLAYQDRLLFISKSKPGELGWSNALDDTKWNFGTSAGTGTGETGVVPDTDLHGMVIHAAQVADAGVKAKVLIAGSNSMYIFSGTALITPSTDLGSDYSIESLATRIGCISPNTMKWTPKGTIYLGTDKQVYILPFDAITPIPIGQKITSSGEGREDGLEAIPASELPSISAVYHEGYYKLSIPARNGAFNSIQYWLDMDRMQIDENRYFGPWYGPMKGMRFESQIVQSGPGDNGEWIGGEGNGTLGGFVYQAGLVGSFEDDSEPISIEYQTFYNPLSVALLEKVIDKLELELRSKTATINIDFLDTTGKVGESVTTQIVQDTILWNQRLWNTFNWASILAVRIMVVPSPKNIKTRYLSIVIKVTSSSDFRLYGIGANVSEQSVPFGIK